jgi:hypothetical protein
MAPTLVVAPALSGAALASPCPSRPPYDPAPSRNAFLTVMAVFAFFGVCFLVVAAWIRCVVRIEGFQTPRQHHRSMRRRAARRSGGFQGMRLTHPACAPP